VADLDMGILNTIPSDDLGVPGAMLLAPGDPALSVLFLRMNTTGPYMMPPLGRSLVDPVGTSVIDAWISSGLGFGEPIDHAGSVDYQAGVDYGFFIWQDQDDGEWHLRWSGDGSHADIFSGTVSATGDFSTIREFSFEGKDALTQIDSTSMSFSAVARSSDDGIDFFLPDGLEVTFDLYINGESATGLIKIGAVDGVSQSGNITLTSNPAIGSLTGGQQNLATVGPPFNYVPKQDVGYVLWQDSDDGEWHLRWAGSSSKSIRFEGVITSDMEISNIRPFKFESSDELLIQSTELRFNATALGWEDGIDFFVPEGAQVSFSLLTDGSSLPDMIRIGPAGVSPVEIPFTLISAMTSISDLGQPSYNPFQDAGYFIWRDFDDGEWHLRWSGDGTKTSKYDGTIISSTGITSVSPYRFEKKDLVTSILDGLIYTGFAGNGEDGLDFFVPEGSQVIFDLLIDGVSQPLSIYVGTQNSVPTTVPFSLFSP